MRWSCLLLLLPILCCHLPAMSDSVRVGHSMSLADLLYNRLSRTRPLWRGVGIRHQTSNLKHPATVHKPSHSRHVRHFRNFVPTGHADNVFKHHKLNSPESPNPQPLKTQFLPSHRDPLNLPKITKSDKNLRPAPRNLKVLGI